jgi:CYTH domain-containing protein
MIKRMESEHIRIGRVADNEVILTINGNDSRLTVDELQEVYRLTQHFWDANNLYQFTKEAIAERERWESERNTAELALAPIGKLR